ncbi:MAG: hypothetical protein AAF687_07785 [Pseudomonadota bacterium]
MTKLQRLPLAIGALAASSPAFAHETELPHIHSEWAVVAAAVALAAVIVIGRKVIGNRKK